MDGPPFAVLASGGPSMARSFRKGIGTCLT
jgi:hypothetical protein